MNKIGTDITTAKNLLEKGEVVAIPTETVYGLAGNALNEDAIVKIFQAKNRPFFDPLIVHIADFKTVEKYVVSIPDAAKRLAEVFMPGALTLLLPRKSIIPDLVTAGSDLVAIRVPAHPSALKLLSELDFPLAAPSANPFGYVSPTTAQHVQNQLGDKISYILDGGSCTIGIESTIVGFDPFGKAIVFRKGGIAIEEIEKVLGEKVSVKEHSSSNPQAPGMLESHYAPRVPVKIVSDINAFLKDYPQDKKLGVLSFSNKINGIPEGFQIQLSPKRDYAEAARNLFAALRALDELKPDLIVTELLPEEDLGRAINDRLRRAGK